MQPFRGALTSGNAKLARSAITVVISPYAAAMRRAYGAHHRPRSWSTRLARLWRPGCLVRARAGLGLSPERPNARAGA